MHVWDSMLIRNFSHMLTTANSKMSDDITFFSGRNNATSFKKELVERGKLTCNDLTLDVNICIYMRGQK